MRKWHFLILGAPGSGKGTLSKRIARDFKLRHVSSGDLLRAQVKSSTPLATKIKAHIANGELVPDSLMIDLLKQELSPSDTYSGILLDGFPRSQAQAEALHALKPVDCALNLKVDDEIIRKRLTGRWIHEPSGRVYNMEWNPPLRTGLDDATSEPLVQRVDDTPDVVSRRLNQYKSIAEILEPYYKEKDVLIDFSGNTSNSIWPTIYNKLATYIEPSNPLAKNEVD